IRGSGANTLTLNQHEVLNLSGNSNTLRVQRNADDTVNMGTGWTQGANETIGGNVFEVFTHGAATLKVQAAAAAPPSVTVENVTAVEGVGLVFTVTLNAAVPGGTR